MAITDTLEATLTTYLSVVNSRSHEGGGFEGEDVYLLSSEHDLTDGSGDDQASGAFSSEALTITTGGITLSLADSADPTAGAGSEVPSSDPEGLKLRYVKIVNLDTTNFVTITTSGVSNANGDMLNSAGASVKLYPEGKFIWTAPDGGSAIEDGTSDEIKLTADTASCTCELHYVFG
jgi:hypothetical protein